MDEAADDCDRALRLNERSINAALYKAEALCGLGELQAANDLLATTLEARPDQADRVQGTYYYGRRVFENARGRRRFFEFRRSFNDVTTEHVDRNVRDFCGITRAPSGTVVSGSLRTGYDWPESRSPVRLRNTRHSLRVVRTSPSDNNSQRGSVPARFLLAQDCPASGLTRFVCRTRVPEEIELPMNTTTVNVAEGVNANRCVC